MSSLPFTSFQYPFTWPDKLPLSSKPAATTLSYPFSLPSITPSLPQPLSASVYPALQSDVGGRSSYCRPVLPLEAAPRLHISPAPALLAEMLQPAFRSVQPGPSGGCDESRVCELAAAAAQRSDAARAQAEAQKDAAMRQWAETVHRRLDELAQLTAPQHSQSAHSERSEQMTRQLAAMSKQLQHAIATTEQLSQRVAAMESCVEHLNQRVQGLHEGHDNSMQTDGEVERTDSEPSSSGRRVKQPQPVNVLAHPEQATTAAQSVLHPTASPATASQTSDSHESEEEDDEQDECVLVEEKEGERQEAAEAEPLETEELPTLPAASKRRILTVAASTPPSRPPSPAVPWSSLSQPSAALAYSRRVVARPDEAKKSTVAPRSSSSAALPASASSVSLPSVGRVGRPRKMARARRDEVSRLREIDGSRYEF